MQATLRLLLALFSALSVLAATTDAAAVVTIDGGPISARPQGETFALSGSGLTATAAYDVYFDPLFRVSSSIDSAALRLAGSRIVGTDGAGSFTFPIVTTCADTGSYRVSVSRRGEPDRTVSFTITDSPGCAAASMISPAPGGLLQGSRMTFTWTSVPGAAQYWLGVEPTGGTPYKASQGRNTSVTLPRPPGMSGTVAVRLWTYVPPTWLFHDYVFHATSLIIDPAIGPRPVASSRPQGGSPFTFEGHGFTPGTSVSRHIRNIGTGAQTALASVQADSAGNVAWTFETDCATQPTSYWLWAVDDTARATSNIVTATVTLGDTCASALQSPASGGTLTGTTQIFRWLRIPSAGQYWLDVGTTPGGRQIYSQTQGGALSASVSNLPAAPSDVYARLWTYLPPNWYYRDYAFEGACGAPCAAALQSPADGATLDGDMQVFTWNDLPGAMNYWLDIGTSPGSRDVQSIDAGRRTAIRAPVPDDGNDVYVRLWTYVPPAWNSRDYVFRTVPTLP